MEKESGSQPSHFSDVKLQQATQKIRDQIREESKGKLKILVVDDYPLARSMYEEFLESKGFSVITASTGEEALSFLKGGSFDLVLLDYRLPDMDGVQVLRILRKNSKEIPVIMITSNNLKDTIEQAVTEGISSYLLKPVQMNLLLERIQQAVKKESGAQEEPPPLV
ncbi:MAG: response regulator [Candidatus Eremiobacteraeota bacterium]|jgi:CheY-like chemotaxis protein|nr:response regulator [Candidatus Eremiobacteraeota bacterium]